MLCVLRFKPIIYFLLGGVTGRLLYFPLLKWTWSPSFWDKVEGTSKFVVPFSSRAISEIPMMDVEGWGGLRSIPSLPKVYVVTATYRRPLQYPELTRIYQALYPVRQAVEWLIGDEHETGSPRHMARLQKFIKRFNISKRLMRSHPRRKSVKLAGNPRGVDARRRVILYLRRNNLTGVIFFADDDNTYDSELFAQVNRDWVNKPQNIYG
jgi:hypothetical protein